METITNAVAGVTNVASKAIWGDQTTKTNETAGKEPVSGELGNVKAGEPYDAGNSDNTSEPKSLGQSTSHAAPSSELPSTSAHTDPKPVSAPITSSIADSIAPGSVTAPVGDAKDDKTAAATQAALVSLQDDTKNLSIGDKDGAGDHRSGDGLVSAKKVGEGEGAHTGVKHDSGLPLSKEPIGVADSSATKSTALGTTAITDNSHSSTDKSAVHGTPHTTTASPAAAIAGSSSTTTTTPSAARKSTSSSSDDNAVDEHGQKKKLSLKEKIKAKLHHSKH